MIASGDNGAVLSGSVEFTPRQMREPAIFLPSQLCR
jgi:hypothetical protein